MSLRGRFFKTQTSAYDPGCDDGTEVFSFTGVKTSNCTLKLELSENWIVLEMFHFEIQMPVFWMLYQETETKPGCYIIFVWHTGLAFGITALVGMLVISVFSHHFVPLYIIIMAKRQANNPMGSGIVKRKHS